MTIEDLIEKLQRLIKAGKIDPENIVMIRNTQVSEDAMDAGSNGYTELDEVLVIEETVYLLIEAY